MPKALPLSILAVLVLLVVLSSPMTTTDYIPRTPVNEETKITMLPSGDAIVQHLYSVTSTITINIEAEASYTVSRVITLTRVLITIAIILSLIKTLLEKFNEIDKLVEATETWIWWRNNSIS